MVGRAALTVGSIVYIKDVIPPNSGQPKNRRVVIVDGLNVDESFSFAVIATRRNPSGELAPNEVIIPHKLGGHPQTSLTQPSVVVCTWVQECSIDRALEKMGTCPVNVLKDVLDCILECDRRLTK